MVKVGLGVSLACTLAIMLGTHPQLLHTFRLYLALAGPLVFAAVYMRNLGLFIADFRRYLKLRFLVRETKKNEKQHAGVPSPV